MHYRNPARCSWYANEVTCQAHTRCLDRAISLPTCHFRSHTSSGLTQVQPADEWTYAVPVLARSNKVVASLLNVNPSMHSLRFLTSVSRSRIEVCRGDWVLLAQALQGPSVVAQVVQLIEIAVRGSMSSFILLACSSANKLRIASDGSYWSSRELAEGQQSEMIVPYESTHITIVMRSDCITHFKYV